MLHESTISHQRYPSPDMKQDTNMRQPIELCYTNQHVDIISVHLIDLSKTQKSMQSIT